MRFRKNQSIWGMYGSGQLLEKRICGIWFYRRARIQKWTPLMHEIEREVGIRIGHVRLGMSGTVKLFFDGKEPREIKGAY